MKLKIFFILGVVLILSKESYAACFSQNDTTSSCRYKEGDTWCRDHKKGMPYAYNCLPSFSENKSESAINNITKNKKYIDNKNGTITDTKTSLMWMKCSLGQSWKNNSCLKKPRPYYWSEIFSAAKKINMAGFSGYSNWRVPTPKELFSLVQCNKRASGFFKYCLTQDNLIDKVFFPNTPNTIYWTSTPDSDGIYAKTVSFHNGLIDSDPMRYNFPVRLVRSQKDKLIKGTKKEIKYLTNEQEKYLYENLGGLYEFTPNLRNKAFKNLEDFLDTVSINALTRPLNRTILFHAVTSPFLPHNRDTIKFVRHLIYLNADVNIADTANITPLHEAVKSGSLELVKLLVKSGADIGAKDKLGRTAVSLSSFMKKEKILKYLGSKLQ